MTTYLTDNSRVADIIGLLEACDAHFTPPLSQRADLLAYAVKMHERANRFEAWSDGVLIGLVAGYIDNATGQSGHITNVSVHPDWTRLGVAARLLQDFIDRASTHGLHCISLEVSSLSIPAVKLYEKFGFVTQSMSDSTLQMKRWIR